MKGKPEMPKGYKRPKQGFDLKSPAMRKRQSTKKQISPGRLKSAVNDQSDAKEGGESEEDL